MTIYEGLDEMRPFLPAGDWDGLEAEFQARCLRRAPSAAQRIASVDLAAFETELRKALARLDAGAASRTQAIYWEFEPDNGWDSSFFQCLSYQPEADGDDEWAADFEVEDVVPGPAAPGLAAEFADGWDEDDDSIARNQYLVARTIAALGRASSGWSSHRPLCAGYHDQEVVYRLRGE